VARDGLGRGLSSLTQLPQALFMNPGGFETEPGRGGIPFHIKMVDSRSSFAQEVAFSASAKFGFTGGGASARISMSSSYHKSQRSLAIILTKTSALLTQFLREPVARLEAVRLAHHRNAFLKTFGDQVVTRVTLGGAMSLVYYLKFQDIETRSEF